MYQEPVSVLAQWMEDGTWRLLKSVEAELVEDAIAYKQLQVRDSGREWTVSWRGLGMES